MPIKKYNNGRRRETNKDDGEIIGIVLVIVSAFFFLCITIRPILGIISRGIYGITTGIFGLFSYPLFLCTGIWGVALIQGRRANISLRTKIGIACMALSLMLILQLATTNARLGANFSDYVSYVYSRKTTAGGVLFGVIAYGIKAAVTTVVSYILYSFAFVLSLAFFILIPLYANRRKEKSDIQNTNASVNAFIKGQSTAQKTMPGGENSLFVATIAPKEENPQIAEKATVEPINSEKSLLQYESPSNAGYKSKAHEILFGNKERRINDSVGEWVAGNKQQADTTDSNKFAMPQVLPSEPYVSDNSKSATKTEEHPQKPKKRVHNLADTGLPEIPQYPEKDHSNEYVNNDGIIDGDDYTAKMEQNSARTNYQLSFDRPEFLTAKLDITKVAPKEVKNDEPEIAPIINGDKYNAAHQPEVKEQDEHTEALIKASYPEEEEEEDTNPSPIIAASEWESERKEADLIKQFENERNKINAESANISVSNILNATETYKEENVSDTPPVQAHESLISDELLRQNEDNSLIATELPEQPRGSSSSFNIIEEPIDLSEESHFEGEDNTGYYDTVSVAKPSVKEGPKPIADKTPITIDDYVARTSAEMAVSKPRKKKRSKYNPPDLDMLIPSFAVQSEDFNAACEEKARLLVEQLEQFKLSVKITGITRGPAVTRYELEMPPGVSVKRIEQLAPDIEYSIASNGKIRIEAPIPGKRAVGIEVPNSEIDVVHLHDIIASKEFQNSSSALSVALGKDIAGDNIICNLDKMPHLLIAGTTGSGKSACLNSVIISLLYKSSPEDVRIILIDPKRVEFNLYEGLPHLLMPQIINDTKQAIKVLNWAKEEMDRRYILLGKYKSRIISEFNKLEVVKSGEEEKLPYIVIIVDELAELMIDTNNRKMLETQITSISQKARAAGIHLILATQRPSVDIITGIIKANLPSRIAFSVKSNVDSRTILDEPGAETLLGRGDMLYSPLGANEPKRVQGAYVTNDEVSAITEYVRNSYEPDFDEEFTAAITKPDDKPEENSGEGEESSEFDNLMADVLKCVIESGSASASMIQRRFGVGYARAARIIDQMEIHNFIGPLEGNNKPRAVYISREQYKELFNNEI